MSEETKTELFLHYARIPNTSFIPDRVEKKMGLRSLGLGEGEVEKLCEPKPVDLDEMIEGVREIQRQHLRDLARLNGRAAKLHKPGRVLNDFDSIVPAERNYLSPPKLF
jgi:hypothetical protein